MRGRDRKRIPASCDWFKVMCIATIVGMVLTTFMFWSSSSQPASLGISNDTSQHYSKASSNSTFSGPHALFSQIPATTVDRAYHFISAKKHNQVLHLTTVTNQPITLAIDQLHHDSHVDLNDPNTVFLELRVSQKPPHGYYNVLIPNTRSNSKMDSEIHYPQIVYTPAEFYTGKDSFKYEIYFLIQEDNQARIYKETGTVEILIKVTPVLTQYMLGLPPGYNTTDMANAAVNIPEVLKIMTSPEFKKSIPAKDFWYNNTWDTCALVFNGGSLRNRSLGKEIDSHTKVFRLNGAVILPYADDVGTKLDIGMSAPLRYGCWVWGDKLNKTDHIWFFGQMNMAPQYEHLAFCEPRWKPREHIFGISWQFTQLGNKVFNEYTTNYTRSTGYLMFLMATTVCDQISVYGMGDSPDGQHHYFESPKGSEKAWSGHSYSLEKQIFQEIASGEGKWKKVFEEYAITKSFRFV